MERDLAEMEGVLRGTALEETRSALERMRSIGLDCMKTQRNLTGPAVAETRSTLERMASTERDLSSTGFGGYLETPSEHTSQLAREMEDVMSLLRGPAYGDLNTFEPSFDLSHIEVPPNPILETNEQLAELTGTVTKLVEIASQQAAVSQAIREASAAESKNATLLARKSLRVALLAIAISTIVALASVYDNHRLSSGTDVQLQQEIHILQKISERLTQPDTGNSPNGGRDAKSTDKGRHSGRLTLTYKTSGAS